MAIDRREFLAGFGSGLAALSVPGVASAEPVAAPEPLFAAPRRSADGRYSAAIFRRDGQDVASVTLPGRGHDVTVCPQTRTCVAFARRPGNFAVAFSRDSARPPIRFTTPVNRHFYGHGVFSHDGRILYATENDFDAARGTIGLYDATSGFRRIGEFDGHGIGPHDLSLMPDGKTLIIANGGIETHPDIGAGRTKLNLATMSPSLVYLDTAAGNLVEKHELPVTMRKLSLRHLDVGAGRTVVIGGQLEDGGAPDMPLILRHRLGSRPVPLTMPVPQLTSLRGYISSVAVDTSGEIAALTASRGSRVVFVEVATGRILGERSYVDVSGVAAGTRGFLLTTGSGAIIAGADAAGASEQAISAWQWDNHAVRL